MWINKLLSAFFALFLFSSPAWAGFVQGKCLDAGSVSSSTLTFNSAVTAGNLLYAVVRYGSATDNYTSVADNVNAGNWTKQLTQVETTDGHTLYMVIKPNTGSGTPTVTVTFSVAATVRYCIAEYSGLATSTPVDAQGSVDKTVGCTSCAGPSVTTTNANDTLITGLATSNITNETASSSAGWTDEIKCCGANVNIAISDQTVSVTGAYQDTYSIGPVGDTIAIGTIALKLAAVPAGTPTRSLLGVGQ